MEHFIKKASCVNVGMWRCRDSAAIVALAQLREEPFANAETQKSVGVFFLRPGAHAGVTRMSRCCLARKAAYTCFSASSEFQSAALLSE